MENTSGAHFIVPESLVAPCAVVLPESRLNSSETLGYVVIRGLDTCKDGTIRSCLNRLGGAWISTQPFGEPCEDAASRNLLQRHGHYYHQM